MADLRLDTAGLRSVSDDLNQVADTFDGTAASAGGTAEAVGHDRLASAVRSFEGSWDHTRGDMVGAIRHVAERVASIASRFEEADAHLGDGIRGAGS